MRAPDFVYGIVPRVGEYGFEVKPTSADQRLVARVRSLASSFEWSGSVGPQAIAIAYDPEPPILVARYGLDPRDPSGRVSLLLHVWVSANALEANQLVDELWKQSNISDSQDAFVKGAGRRITGPDRSFYVTDFDSVLGGQAKKMSSEEVIRQQSRNTVRPRSHKSRGTPFSGGKVSAGLALLCLGLAGLAFYSYDQQEKTKVMLENVRKERDVAQSALKIAETTIGKLQDEKGKLDDKVSSLEKGIASKNQEISEKDGLINGYISVKTELQAKLNAQDKPLDAVREENVKLRASKEKLQILLDKSTVKLEAMKAAIGDAQAALEGVLKPIPEQRMPAGESQDQNKESPSDIRTETGSEPPPGERQRSGDYGRAAKPDLFPK